MKTKNEDIEKVLTSDLIFFAGGQQLKFVNALSSDFIKTIQNRFHEDNVLIAGTSAGAMILSKIMIAEGGNEDAQVDEDLDLRSGLNLLPNFIIDTHFIQRGRYTRLAQAIKHYPNLLGIGIESDTAIIVQNEYLIKTFGCGTLTIIDGSEIKACHEGLKKECIVNLKTHLIVSDCTVNLNDL